MKLLTEKLKSQSGVNMVDLMMWLVIAALLLAAAIQGIGYYQKNATLYQMKNDASNAANAVLARMSAIDGVTTDTVAAEATVDSAKTAGITTVAETGSSDAHGFVIRSTSETVPESDVIFLSAQRGSWAPGIHVVPKGTMIASDGTTTVTSPDDGDSGGESPTVTDPTSIMAMNWDTTGTCSTITLPIAVVGSGTTVDWGDGNGPQLVTTSYPSKSFTSASTNTGNIVVDGTFDRFGDWREWSAECLESIDSWGDGTRTISLMGAFAGTQDLKLTSIARIPLSVTELTSVFEGSDFNGDVSKWDTSNVTDMRWAFSNAPFNGDISKWDTSNTVNMECMFCVNPNFNQDITKWDVQKVENFNAMFSGATAFNQKIGVWKTSSLTTMHSVFYGASSFNQDIGNWDTSKVTNMRDAFHWATSFNQPLFQRDGGWDTSNVTLFDQMFEQATSFNQDIGNWNVSQGTNFASMFKGASSFNQDISSWTFTSSPEMGNMFENASVFNQDLSGWIVHTDSAKELFYSGSSLTQEHLPTFN